jgi:hypothetical protein
LAAFPKMWFDIMNPLVDFYRKNIPLNKELNKQSDNKLWKFILGLNFNFIMLVILQNYSL